MRVDDVSDEDMRDLLSSKDVGSGRARLKNKFYATCGTRSLMLRWSAEKPNAATMLDREYEIVGADSKIRGWGKLYKEFIEIEPPIKAGEMFTIRPRTLIRPTSMPSVFVRGDSVDRQFFSNWFDGQ